MYRLIQISRTGILIALTCLFAFMGGCIPKNQVVRDQLVVEKLRLRITKVRYAAKETRDVIAASRGAKYLPELHMRLAELLSEEARYHYMVAYEREQRSTKALHVPQVRFLKEQAIAIYQSIIERYPDTHLADRILFNISHEQRELGQFDKMKASLEKLVKDHPDSPYRNEALLVLGDYYFDKTKFEQAKSYFDQIVNQRGNVLRSLAMYKLGWVDVNQGNCKLALSHFEKAIKAARLMGKKSKAKQPRKTAMRLRGDFAIPRDEDDEHQFAGHNTVNVQHEALVDLTYCYAQERKPENAVAYLRDLASTRASYVAALGKLANRYALIEQPRGAADVARELLRLAPDDAERLDDARMLHTAVTRMKDYSQVGEDVFLVLRAMRRQMLKPSVDEGAARLLHNEFELIARDLATKSQEVLMSKEKVTSKWTKTPATFAQTAAAYIAYLDAFPDSDNRVMVVQNLADTLMEAEWYLQAGHRYREAAQLLAQPVKMPDPQESKDPKKGDKTKKAKTQKVDIKALEKQRKQERKGALYEAVVAYQKFLDSITTRTHFERASARAGLRAAGGMYLSEANPDAERARKIKFAIAQSYYDEGRYLNAIDLLTAIAYEFSQTRQGDAAVHMVLDSYKTINDISGLINVGRRFLAKDSPVSPELKGMIKPIVAAAEQNRLDELSLAASGEQVGGMEVLLKFADRYKNTDLGERALLSAFVAARAGGDSAQLYDLGEKVLAQFPGSDQAGGVVSTMGRAAATRFEFDRAIQYMEKAAAISQDQKATLLIAAGELRAQLADRDGAIKNYRAAVRAAGEGPGMLDAMRHLVDLIAMKGNPKQVVKELEPLGDTLDAELSSRLGMAKLQLGEMYDAEDYFRAVVEGAGGASATTQAQAHFGMAEVMLDMLEKYEPPQEIDAIEELIGVIDVTLQAYLSAARQPDPRYSQASLARLARVAIVGAEKLENIQLPSELTQEESTLVKGALAARAKQLRADSAEVMAECAQRAKDGFLLDEAGRACIRKEPPKKNPISYSPLKKRSIRAKLETAKDSRDRLSKNPDDLEALRKVASAFLQEGDAHAARLVLARAVEAGGDANDLNEFGVACYKSGDTTGALDAFKRAKDAGSVAAIVNLATICDQLGLKDMAAELRKKKEGDVVGTLIQKGGGA